MKESKQRKDGTRREKKEMGEEGQKMPRKREGSAL